MDHIRRQARYAPLTHEPATRNGRPWARVAKLLKAVDRLPAEQRELVEQAFFSGMSDRQIAARRRQGAPGTLEAHRMKVRRERYRAITALRSELQR